MPVCTLLHIKFSNNSELLEHLHHSPEQLRKKTAKHTMAPFLEIWILMDKDCYVFIICLHLFICLFVLISSQEEMHTCLYISHLTMHLSDPSIVDSAAFNTNIHQRLYEMNF